MQETENWRAKVISPSQERSDYWIREYSAATTPAEMISPNLGKWLISPLKENLDAVWLKVAKATKQGELGIAAKTSTAKLNPNSINPKLGVVCIYTYDFQDVQDVQSALIGLRNLGFEGRLNYKANEQTYAGEYSGSAGGAVCIYTSSPDSTEMNHPKKWKGVRLIHG